MNNVFLLNNNKYTYYIYRYNLFNFNYIYHDCFILHKPFRTVHVYNFNDLKKFYEIKN